MLNRLFRSGGTQDGALPETDVAQTQEARLSGAAQIVDVREPDEWADGHIPGVIHIPLGSLANRRQELDPSRPVIAVCRSGKRSLTAVEILAHAGFTDAKSMAGGMIAWSARRLPVER